MPHHSRLSQLWQRSRGGGRSESGSGGGSTDEEVSAERKVRQKERQKERYSQVFVILVDVVQLQNVGVLD